MSKIAREADKNGMSARNLAICCPNLFIGCYAQRCLDGRQFQSMMYLSTWIIFFGIFFFHFWIFLLHFFLPFQKWCTRFSICAIKFWRWWFFVVEFFIINPHAFLPMDTAATVIREDEGGDIELLFSVDFPMRYNLLFFRCSELGDAAEEQSSP